MNEEQIATCACAGLSACRGRGHVEAGTRRQRASKRRARRRHDEAVASTERASKNKQSDDEGTRPRAHDATRTRLFDERARTRARDDARVHSTTDSLARASPSAVGRAYRARPHWYRCTCLSDCPFVAGSVARRTRLTGMWVDEWPASGKGSVSAVSCGASERGGASFILELFHDTGLIVSACSLSVCDVHAKPWG